MEYNNNSPRSTLDQKADLYSILKTAEFLRHRFSQGMVESGFFIKRMQSFSRELSQLQTELMRHRLTLLQLLDKMQINQDLRSIIVAISSAEDLQFHDFAQQWQIDPYKLAYSTAEITSAFITLLDYLHLVDIVEDGLLIELFDRLLSHLQTYHTFSPFYNAVGNLRAKGVEFIRMNLGQHPNKMDPPQTNQSFYPSVEYQLSLIFDKFKNYLNLS